MDEFAEIFGNLVGLAIILMTVAIAVVFIGMIVAPIGLVGGGTLYYLNNIHVPEKRRREAQQRTRALYAQAQQLSPSFDQVEQALFEAGIESAELHRIAKVLYQQEGLQPPVLPPVGDDPIKLARYQVELEKFINAAQPDHYQEFERHLIWALSEYEPDSSDESQMFHSKRQRSKLEIERLILRFVNDDGLFKGLTDQLNENYFAENEVMPSVCKHDDYVWSYLKNTPLLPLADVQEMVGLQDRMYHTYLLGSSGSGKTNLIENIIAHDLRSDEDCCVIVIDSQTQLIDKLAKLDIPNTTHITPKYNLALNLFDVGYEEMKGRGIEGETLINKTVGLLSFVLEGMMWAEFTNPQKTIFQYVIQLVISIKGGNINTFMDVLADGGHERYADEISQLDENMQRFFAVDYPAPDYKRTREAIRRRMDGLLRNPTFRRLFSATENKIDMFEEMANQKLILIDTNKPMLDDAPSAFFGRLFIALILRASYRRFGGAKTERPVYLIVDEAHEYFDRSISDMLEQARKANIGLIVAHQSISQARGAKGGSNITDPLMVNTATKLIWTSFREDATKFAGSMQVKAEDILTLPQFTFGMHSRKQGFAPVKGVPRALEGFEKRDDSQSLQEEMEEKYGPTLKADEDRPDDDPDAPHASGVPNKPTNDPGGIAVPPEVEVI
ncbi:hypothetical protein BCF46_0960 [Litoreibacter meonggei]|uniref:Uncharacterized protein n=1 Tax=Litoreibacter meonggei TaxID=1049199 RepID=A0A497X6I7_9RHOB|nr:hypothetical protein [Litoreibacter meonggei]RLJ60754.1 hypothetical protein BCF46_0960 [Litoreibacter meonggei]